MENFKERNEKIVDLWNTGLTATEIGKRFKISRNAVMGVIHRVRGKGEDVQKRVIPKIIVKPPTRGGPLMVRKIMAKIKTKRKKEDTQQMPLPFFAPASPASGNCSIMELTLFTCRYVIGDTMGINTVYCGDIVDGRSYCTAHKKLCYHYANPIAVKPTHPARYA